MRAVGVGLCSSSRRRGNDRTAEATDLITKAPPASVIRLVGVLRRRPRRLRRRSVGMDLHRSCRWCIKRHARSLQRVRHIQGNRELFRWLPGRLQRRAAVADIPRLRGRRFVSEYACRYNHGDSGSPARRASVTWCCIREPCAGGLGMRSIIGSFMARRLRLEL